MRGLWILEIEPRLMWPPLLPSLAQPNPWQYPISLGEIPNKIPEIHTHPHAHRRSRDPRGEAPAG
jgi:hypothetical protein